MSDSLNEVRKGRSEAIILTSNGLVRTSNIGCEKFEILFGERIFDCNRFQAAFLSRSIHRVLLSDSTINTFEFDGYESNFELFEEFAPLMFGRTIVINEENCLRLEHLAHLLDNDELLNLVMKFELGEGELTVSNCLFRLRTKVSKKCEYEGELEFVASHFYEFDSSRLELLKEFKVDILERILTSKCLRLKDEDSLLDFISVMGDQSSTLANCVECQFLSISGMERLLSLIRFDEIGWCVWESICRRLRCKHEDPILDKKRINEHLFECPYHEGREFDGILVYLTKQCSGNVHEKGTIQIDTPYVNCTGIRFGLWQVLAGCR
jgi:hypothetical protein